MIATHSAIHLVHCCHDQMSLIAVSYPIIFIHGNSNTDNTLKLTAVPRFQVKNLVILSCHMPYQIFIEGYFFQGLIGREIKTTVRIS